MNDNPTTDRYAAAAAAERLPFGHADQSTVVIAPKSGRTVVHSRVPQATADAIIAEAQRCRQTGSALIADLIDEALAARQATSEQQVTVNLADLHRAIDHAVRAA